MIGALSAYLLHISQEKFLLWTGLIILMMLAMLLVASLSIKTIKNAGHVCIINRDEYVFIFNRGSWASF